MAQRIARPIHLVLAWLFVAGVVVQVFLAGMGVFAGPAEFETHAGFGYLLTALPLALVVTGLIGRMGRRQVVVAGVAFGQFILQSLLVLQRDSVPAIAALHPVNGFVIGLVAVWLARDAWRAWQVQPATVAEPVAAELPAR